MPFRKIVLYGNPVLRYKSHDVEKIDEGIRGLIAEMIETMEAAEGIGLAAPQVGESVSLCVVNSGLIEDGLAPKAYINPVIHEEIGSVAMEEGCLSIPDISESVTRAETIRLTYLDENGTECEETCNGMLARVLQHEIDHLNGVLFIDRISNIRRKLLEKKLRNIATGSQ